MIIEQIEDTFKLFFQNQVKIGFGNTTIKQGKFIILKSNAFSLDFFIKTGKPTTEIVSIPLPFKFYKEGNVYMFDYSIDEIIVKDSSIHNVVMDYIRKNKTSKFLNNKISFLFN